MQASSGRDTATEVSVTANGNALPTLIVSPQTTLHTVQIDPAWIDASGDLRLDFTSPTFRAGNDRRDLGFLADFVRIEMPAGLTLPALPQLLLLLLCVSLLYIALRAVWLRPLSAAAISSFFILACVLTIGIQRLLLTIFTARLALVLLLAILVAVVVEPLVRLLTSRAGWHEALSLPQWSWAVLRGLLMLTVLLKVGGVLYPYSFIIDAPFHLKYVTYAAEGRPFEEYFGKSLAFSVMPKEEWGSARAFIPYSPFFYFAAAPLKLLAVPLEVSVPAASALFEALKVALVFLVGLALGASRRSVATAARLACAAAAVYAFIPATFLLQQWGNWPTLTSLWLLTLWVAITALFWHRITSPIFWLVSTLTLALTMLSYTVTNIYTAIFIGIMVTGGWLVARGERRRWAALAFSAASAALLAVLIYYGRYIPALIQETLPTFSQAIESQGKLTKLRPSLEEFFTLHLGRAMQSYNLVTIYSLCIAGALWVFMRGDGAKKKPHLKRSKASYSLTARLGMRNFQQVGWQKVWLAAWLITVPLFTAADFYVDQAFKEFWYSFPAVALIAGSWLLALWRKKHASWLYTAFLGLLAIALIWQSLSLWVFRLLFH